MRRLVASALLVPLTLTVVAADDGASATVAIDRADITVADGSITVEGEVSFEGGLVIEDDLGDSTAPGFGFDIESATITQLDLNTMEFALTVADLQVDTLPVARLEFPVVSISGAEIELWAWRTYANALTADPSADWTFTIATISSAGFLESAVDGELDGSTFIWRAPIGSIGGREGQWLSGDDDGDALAVQPIKTSFGVAGLLSGGSTFDSVDQDTGFVIGGTTRIELRTASGAWVADATGKVRKGSYTSVLTDVAPGNYLLTIVAEYADVFTEKVVPIKVA